MATLRAELEPDREDVQELERWLRALLRPTRSERRRVADAVREGFLEAFRYERSGRGPWAPLAPATVADRIYRGYPGRHPILQRTRRYRWSWVDRNAPDHVERWRYSPSEWQVVVGSAHHLVPFHELGTRRMPARPVSWLGAQQERRIEAVLERLFYNREP